MYLSYLYMFHVRQVLSFATKSKSCHVFPHLSVISHPVFLV